MKKTGIIIISLVVLTVTFTSFISINLLNKDAEIKERQNLFEEVEQENLKDEKKKSELEDTSQNESLNNQEVLTTNDNANNNDIVNDNELNKAEDAKDTNKNNEKSSNEKSSGKENTTNEKKNNVSSSENVNETLKKELKETTYEKRNTEQTKYGTKITKITTYEIKKYSDGTKEEKEIASTYTYDFKSFNGKTLEMKDEAVKNVKANQKIYEEVLNYTNIYRQEKNTASLVLDENLSISATIRAIEMAYADKFSHERPNMSGNDSCFTVLNDMGISYSSAGENIAYGYPDSKAVTVGWRNSEGHYANMINSSYGKIGVGMYKLNGKIYWVQMFTN